jgi:molecular chaperone HtpG
MKKFKAQSERILKLMVDSIYTNKEIFLRELVSNASDALDKARFSSLTSGEDFGEFYIEIFLDKQNRTLSIFDTGIGMNAQELETNLGTIAESGTEKFKALNQPEEKLIGKFGVGFYSAFMVAKRVEVDSMTQDGQKNKWTSDGSGYEISQGERSSRGSTVKITLKDNTEEDDYDMFLSTDFIKSFVKKHSDYVRFPIYFEYEKETFDQESKDFKKENCREVLNSMVPIWKKQEDKEATDAFFMDKYYAATPPLETIKFFAEGKVSFHALLFFPEKAPFDYFAVEYERGLSLYSGGVLIMENCKELLPDYLGFIKGVVDSDDISLNISREMLQKTRQLSTIAKHIESKILSAMRKMLKDEREKYERLFSEFGAGFKFGLYNNYGIKKDELKDLCLFFSSKQEKMVTLSEYVAQMGENKNILYAAGQDISSLKNMPIVDSCIEKGIDVLLLTDRIDEFVMKILGSFEDKPILSVFDKKALEENETSEEKKEEEESKGLLEKLQNALEGRVKKVELNARLAGHASFITSDNEISIEMEKVLHMAHNQNNIKAEKVLQINPEHDVFAAVKLSENQESRLKDFAIVLYGQAMLLAGLPLENMNEFIVAINNIAGIK